MGKARFEWDDEKDKENRAKHGISFSHAQRAFFDPNRVIAEDVMHSESESRHFCIGEVAGGIVAVRFTHRQNVIRIFGAGYWRKGKRVYEKANTIHK